MLIQHDIVCLRTSLQKETIAKFGWTVLPYSPYSPDLVPSDFHLSGPLKDTLLGTRFEGDRA